MRPNFDDVVASYQIANIMLFTVYPHDKRDFSSYIHHIIICSNPTVRALRTF